MRDVGSDKTMAEETRKQSGLGSLLAIWSRRKWLAMLAFSGPMAVGMSLVAFLPNIYRSTATVLVDRQQVPEAFVRSTVTSALETRLHTISQEVLSRARLEDLINRFGLYVELRKQAPLEDVIARMRGTSSSSSKARSCEACVRPRWHSRSPIRGAIRPRSRSSRTPSRRSTSRRTRGHASAR